MIDDAYALELYMMAVSVIEAKGAFISVGVTRLKEFRNGTLTIHYMPRTGHIDVWSGRKVFSVRRLKDGLRVAQYAPGEWEEELERAAGKPLPN